MSTNIPVITGIGVMAPGGTGVKNFWDLLMAGQSATRTISLFDASPFRSRIAAEVQLDPDAAERIGRASGTEARADSGLEQGDFVPERAGVVLGSAVGCTISLENVYVQVSSTGQNWLVDEAAVDGDLYSYLVPSSAVRDLAWSVGAEGPATMISTGCTAGIDAVSQGCQLIR